MTDLAERIAQTSLWGHDDSRAKKERLRKVMAPKVDPPIPDGPHCAVCRHWGRPGEGDVFGVCGLLVVITERIVGEMDKGTVTTMFAATAAHLPYEELTTKPHFAGCSVFAKIGV